MTDTTISLSNLVLLVNSTYGVDWTPANETTPNLKVYWLDNHPRYRHADFTKPSILTAVVQSLVNDGVLKPGNISVV